MTSNSITWKENYLYPIAEIVFAISIVIAGAYVLDDFVAALPGPVYASEVSGQDVEDCNEVEPSNPYREGTGHYAGFEWSQEDILRDCDAKSDSFNEGCDLYKAMFDDFQKCEDKIS